jgi:cell division protein FtsL
MDRVQNLTQAYSETPWRRQMLVLVRISVVMVIIAVAATIHLTVTAQTAKYGRAIQQYQIEIRDLEFQNSDLQAKLAKMTSAEEMAKQAATLGFVPLKTENVEFVKIPGYVPPQPVLVSVPLPKPVVNAEIIPPEYTESVLVWLVRQANINQLPATSEAQP